MSTAIIERETCNVIVLSELEQERLERGLQEAKEGKVVSAAWFMS